MTPEILIVGDPAGRRELADMIAACGYGVASCEPRELNRRVRVSSPPAAIVACIADLDPEVMLAGLRRTRAGASIPVLLYGQLGGELRDLADVLDLGADHFIEAPAEPDQLADALAQYVGPPQRSPAPPAGSRRGPSRERVEPRAHQPEREGTGRL
ncbi:MAG: hypothetical protein KC457_30615, partial [Myxococcales bacterium]|nr:hypothetical protein [Myxococcales bacterium]